MEILNNYLKIINKELAYQTRVYKGQTERYQELLRQKEIVEGMIVIINKKNNH